MSTEEFDEFCDQEIPRQIKINDVLNAADQLRDHIVYTPCMRSLYQKDFLMRLYYKLETRQKTGSFKERGILCALLRLPEKKIKNGVVIASLGNAAMALCVQANRLHAPVTIIMPSTVPMSKLEKCRRQGAKVYVRGNNLMKAQKFAQSFAKTWGITYINGRDHPDVLAGYGTMALEILQQMPKVNAIIVPVGCGGLAAAVSSVVKSIKPKCLVYGVQTERMPIFFKSINSGEPLVMGMRRSIAEELTVSHVGVNSLFNAKQYVDKMLLVNDAWIARSILHLSEKERLVVEGAGACPLAAIIGQLVPELKLKRVVCILSGGNVDPILFSRFLDKGLSAEGRLMKFRVTIENSSAAQAQLFKLLASKRYNVVQQTRTQQWLDNDPYRVEISLICQTLNILHALELKELITKAYPLNSVFENNPYRDKKSCACYEREDVSYFQLNKIKRISDVN